MSQDSTETVQEAHNLPEPASRRQWQAWKLKELPPAEQMVPGIWSIPVVIPNHPMRFTFCYAVAGDDGVILIDPGWSAADAWAGLLSGLAAAGIQLAHVRGVVLTHAHPDHYGLAPRIQRETGAWIAMHRLEAATMVSAQGGGSPGPALEHLRRAGVPGEIIAALPAALAASRGQAQESAVEVSRLLEDGDYLDLPGTALRVVWTPGHTPGSICLYDEKNDILFTGDHVLPRISPNVGMHPTSSGSPLADYLSSLRSIASFTSASVAPGHEYRFDALVPRLGALAAHHDDRLDEILGTVSAMPGSTLWDIAANISWSRGWAAISGLMLFMALGETRAHLEVLTAQGGLAISTDEDSVTRYTARNAAPDSPDLAVGPRSVQLPGRN